MFTLFTEEELEEMRKKAEERERRELIAEAEKRAEKAGEERGKILGENRGKEIEKEETASKMRKKGFDLQTIMELTGLSKEKILTL